MSAVPETVQRRLDWASSQEQALQHPNFDVASLAYHLPALAGRDAHGTWSLDGVEFDFRLYGQLSAQHTYLGPYGDMLYHKSKSRYVGPWVVGDALRAKKKLSLVLPDTTDATPYGRTLARQYEHLQNVQQSNFAEVTADLPVAARCKSAFVFRCPDRWRVSAVSDNIYLRDPAHGQDFETIQHADDPQGILSRMVGGVDSALFVHEPSMIDEMGRNVPSNTAMDVFRAGSWVEVYCKLRVWISKDGPVQSLSYHVVFDAVQFLCKGTVKETGIRSLPTTSLKRKREFGPVVGASEKRLREEIDKGDEAMHHD